MSSKSCSSDPPEITVLELSRTGPSVTNHIPHSRRQRCMLRLAVGKALERFWADRRQPFLYRIREELPVVRPRSMANLEKFPSSQN
jgi:hypothetical protein